jgi:septum formation protein
MIGIDLPQVHTVRQLILASTSPYRRDLLARLRLPFDVVRPEVDEAELEGEGPEARARRLSLAKAQAVAERYPQALVIGSDQVAALGAHILDKPGNADNARAQLATLSGNTARFFTGCAFVGCEARLELVHIDVTSVTFRSLTAAEIAHYVATEQPFDCAGASKVEGLGIALLEQIDSVDPTALIGLPLIWVAGALRAAGWRSGDPVPPQDPPAKGRSR